VEPWVSCLENYLTARISSWEIKRSFSVRFLPPSAFLSACKNWKHRKPRPQWWSERYKTVSLLRPAVVGWKFNNEDLMPRRQARPLVGAARKSGQRSPLGVSLRVPSPGVLRSSSGSSPKFNRSSEIDSRFKYDNLEKNLNTDGDADAQNLKWPEPWNTAVLSMTKLGSLMRTIVSTKSAIVIPKNALNCKS